MNNPNIINWQWDKPNVEMTIRCKKGSLLSVYRSIKHMVREIAFTIIEVER